MISGRVSTTSPTTPTIKRLARSCCLGPRRSCRASTRSTSALTQQRTNTIGELGANITQINGWAQSIAQLNQTIKQNTIAGLPVNDLEDQRDLLANQLAEASGATIQRGPVQPSERRPQRLIARPREQRRTRSRSTPAAPTRSCAVPPRTTRQRSRPARPAASLIAINTTIPNYIAKLDNVATTLARRGQPAARSDQRLARGRRARTRARPATSSSKSRSTAARSTNVSVAGADWSGAGGAAALQTALANRGRTARSASGNATVIGHGRQRHPAFDFDQPGGRPRSCRFRPPRATTGSRRCSAPRRLVPTVSVVARSSLATTAATFALTGLVDRNPAAVAAGLAAGGPLDGSATHSRGRTSRRSRTVPTRCTSRRRASRCRHADRDGRDQIQQQRPEPRQLAPAVLGCEHRRRDDEPRRVPARLRGGGSVHVDDQLNARHLDQPHGRMKR